MSASAAIDPRDAEIARLREALRQYARHAATCALNPPTGAEGFVPMGALCTCGLAAAVWGPTV